MTSRMWFSTPFSAADSGPSAESTAPRSNPPLWGAQHRRRHRQGHPRRTIRTRRASGPPHPRAHRGRNHRKSRHRQRIPPGPDPQHRALGRLPGPVHRGPGPLLGAVPGRPRTILATGFSGLGFKMAPAAGARAVAVAHGQDSGGHPALLPERFAQVPH